jgi:hypothetical protein
MKTIITATAPTIYQLRSLREFGMPVTDQRNGSYSACQEFDSEEDAIEYLTNRAENYFETEEEIEDAIEIIEKYGQLRLDAVTAYIETI